jgi:hypothetical protein
MSIEVSAKVVRELMRKEDEREMFEAADIGLKTVEAAFRAIALARNEARWSQMAYLVGNIREKASLLRHGKRLAPLQLPDNAKPIKDFMQ